VGSDLSGEQLIRTLHRVLGKCDQIPNTGLLDVWVQRLVQPRNAGSKSGERLCRIANGEDIGLWNATWLKSSLRQAIENAKIVNTEELAALSPEIQPWEVCMFPKA
jgi:hypothetical protein